MASYEQTRSDFEYLEFCEPLNDQVELDAMRLDLMRNPTKRQAAKMYEAGIRLWFGEHGDYPDQEAIRISERYGVSI